MSVSTTPQAIIDFWMSDDTQPYWFSSTPEFDRDLAERYGDLVVRAGQGEFYSWRDTPVGCVAEIIVLDQFPRNIYRDTPAAFAHDPVALVLAQTLVARTADYESLPQALQRWAIMPYMHSESRLVQAESLRLFKALGDDNTWDYAVRHQEIIERFGRYPHRNAILGRESTAEELVFLQEPNSSF